MEYGQNLTELHYITNGVRTFYHRMRCEGKLKNNYKTAVKKGLAGWGTNQKVFSVKVQ